MQWENNLRKVAVKYKRQIVDKINFMSDSRRFYVKDSLNDSLSYSLAMRNDRRFFDRREQRDLFNWRSTTCRLKSENNRER